MKIFPQHKEFVNNPPYSVFSFTFTNPEPAPVPELPPVIIESLKTFMWPPKSIVHDDRVPVHETQEGGVKPVYYGFAKPFHYKSPPAAFSVAPVVVKCILPFPWRGPAFLPRHSSSIRTSFSTEESYILRPNESEMERRIVEILSGGVYSFLKKEGLLKGARRGGEGKRYTVQGMELDKMDELDDLIRRLTEEKDLS